MYWIRKRGKIFFEWRRAGADIITKWEVLEFLEEQGSDPWLLLWYYVSSLSNICYLIYIGLFSFIYIYIWAKLRYSTLGSLLKNFWHLSNLTTQANDVKTFFFSSFFFLYCNYKRTHGFRSWHCRISPFCWRINRYHHQKQTKKLPEKKKKKGRKGEKSRKLWVQWLASSQNRHLLHRWTDLRHSQIVRRAQPLQDRRLHRGDIHLLLLSDRRFSARSSVRIVKVRVSIVSPVIKNRRLLYFLLSSLFFCWRFFVCFWWAPWESRKHSFWSTEMRTSLQLMDFFVFLFVLSKGVPPLSSWLFLLFYMVLVAVS